ncbi:hypothetical protein [Agarivorans sp. OAG1]|uniref:Uncharacterized protein n=1 Tax=Agarivorans albus MKT 106 TaxID=1331007 RepID=R9PRK5_AGAAL|nr:hypothetical protein AALB_4112 [Agarivorans albus MKT 106]
MHAFILLVGSATLITKHIATRYAQTLLGLIAWYLRDSAIMKGREEQA